MKQFLAADKRARCHVAGWGLCALLACCGATARADNFEIEVYGSETTPKGETMVELHSNYTVYGERDWVNGVYPSYHAWHNTLEVAYGFTSWFETAFYVFTSVQPGAGPQWVGDNIRPRVRVPEDWKWPVGLSLSTEVGYMQRSFSEDTWSWEIRPIIDKEWGRWYFAINPAFEKSIHGLNSSAGFEFTPSAKVSFKISKVFSPGVEYYTSLGPVTHFDKLEDQWQQIIPVIDLNLHPKWEINFGVGFGLTRGTDDLIVKLIVGRTF
jgi:hypothetical protein